MALPRFMRKQCEETWRDEISCRFWYWAYRMCERLGGHYWGAWKTPTFFLTYPLRGNMERTCRLCRCSEVQPLPVTQATATASHITITFQ